MIKELGAAFQAYGATRKTPYYPSGRTPDGRVVMTFWQERFGPNMSYSSAGETSEEWKHHHNRARMEDLRWALERWEGKMGVVIIRPDGKDHRAFSAKNLLMQLDGPILETGEFMAVNIGAWNDWKV